MIFNEIYGNYYRTIEEILDAAVERSVSKEQVEEIAKEKAFEDGFLTIARELSEEGNWPLLNKERRAVLHRKTSMPLTTLEKRWLKTLVSDRASSKGYIVRWVEAPSNKLLTTAFEASLESAAVTLQAKRRQQGNRDS